MPKISIVIRARDEEKYIEKVLEEVFSQEFDDCEVIVIDSGSEDRTVEIVRQFPIRLLEIIPPQDFSYGYALNLGTQRAQGEIIVYLSAHCVPTNNQWLKNLVSHFDNLEVGGVYGRQIPRLSSSPMEKRGFLLSYGEEREIQTRETSFSNSNSAIRKQIWQEVNFDEEIEFSEDLVWAKRVLSKGYKLIYEPKADVYHSHEHSLSEIYFREINRHRSRIRRGFAPENKLKTLLSLMFSEMREDILFCLREKEPRWWLIYIPFYHLILLLARCQVQLALPALEIRKKLKCIKLMRRAYNYFVSSISYAREHLKYRLACLRERIKFHNQARNILVIRTSGIGDVIRTTPILEKLRAKFPQARIDYFTSKVNSILLKSNPHIDGCYTEQDITELLKREYDLVINWQIFDNCPYTKSFMKRIKSKQMLGRKFLPNGDYYFDVRLRWRTWIEQLSRIAFLPYKNHDIQKVKIYFSEDCKQDLNRCGIEEGKKYVGICLGGNEAYGCQYWFRNFSIEFLKRLIHELNKKYDVILVGCLEDRNAEDQIKLKEMDKENHRIINLIDKISLEELIAIIRRCACFISSDTGPLYLALALKVPLIALFSNNPGDIYLSPKKRISSCVKIYNDRLDCFPCQQLFRKECLNARRAQCIERIPVSEIRKEVDFCITRN